MLLVMDALGSPLVIAIAEQQESDAWMVGHLGAELGELARRGLSVPDGFVVTAQAFLHAMDCAGVREALRCGGMGLSAAGPLQIADTSTRLQTLVYSAGMPDEVRDAILSASRGLRAARLMVSASEIEASDGSPAAMPRASYVIVKPANVCDAVLRCWASRFSQHALRTACDEPGDPGIAVVVQRMLECEKAGMLHTTDPASGDRSLAVVDGADLDHAVLGARVDPNTYVVDKNARRVVARACTRRSSPELEMELHSEMLPHERSTRVLEDAELASLADLARALDELYGAPRTIEWALSRQQLYVVRNLAPAGAARHAGHLYG